jgi:hypothetical protein
VAADWQNRRDIPFGVLPVLHPLLHPTLIGLWLRWALATAVGLGTYWLALERAPVFRGEIHESVGHRLIALAALYVLLGSVCNRRP